MSNLEDIGFYTLSDDRVRQVSHESQMWRVEILITDRCNFRCPYCRGLSEFQKGDIEWEDFIKILDSVGDKPIKNIRFSGGEPTIHPKLLDMVKECKKRGVERVAISTNGSADFSVYKKLINVGVDDFSISMDACCASVGEQMIGFTGKGIWEKTIENIRKISKLAYVTTGMVFTKDTAHTISDVIKYADELGVADIRIITASQNDGTPLPIHVRKSILDKHPILRYRINNYHNNRNVRGIKSADYCKCPLVLDDMAVVVGRHYPCIIYLREGGDPIGKVNQFIREERKEWFENHNTKLDPICSKNCLDVCVDYNNKYRELRV
jgi:MoaA/NifB/PqqE/SkfB family radical SAM enzyme